VTENFVLPLSHDEVVHMKKSLLDKMPRRCLAALCQPAPVLCLAVRASRQETAVHGSEFGQWNEWKESGQLDWVLLDFPAHDGLRALLPRPQSFVSQRSGAA